VKKPRLGDVVEVEWEDSEHIGLGWRSTKTYAESAEAPQSYRTAGYFVGRGRR
jgi:hypothetical protein